MLRRELGVDVDLEAGAYGAFEVLVDGDLLVDGGSLAFLGVLPPLSEIRARVEERLRAAMAGGA